MNTLHTTTKLKAANYHNPELREINSKLYFSNAQLEELTRTLEPTYKISSSISRDLGIEMRQNPEHKRALAEATTY